MLCQVVTKLDLFIYYLSSAPLLAGSSSAGPAVSIREAATAPSAEGHVIRTASLEQGTAEPASSERGMT